MLTFNLNDDFGPIFAHFALLSAADAPTSPFSSA